MALKGIDISHYNGWPFNSITEQAYQQSDFVIIKATQWMASYKWEGYYRPAMDRARKDGKLLAAYHYATGLTAKREAAYFYSIIKDDLAKGDLIPAIDWEPDDNSAWRSKTWVKAFCEAFYALAGIYPMLYTGVTGCGDCSNLATLVPLWFAGYPDNRNSWSVPVLPDRYNLGKFKEWAIWQYTSSGGKLDRNTSKLTKAQWKAMCKPINKEATKETKETKTGTCAADILAVLQHWIGKSRAKGTHKDIIDLYNSYTPRARGYKVTYTDDYCATTVSAAFIGCGAVDLIGGTECGVERMIEDVFKPKGIWKEDGSVTPKVGDIVCYNWDDSTQPNTGWADHIGVVEFVDTKAKKFVVIEGNMNGVVGRRTVKFGWGKIRGFARPKYAAGSTKSETGSSSSKAEVVKTTATPDSTGAPSKTPKWVGTVTGCSLLNVRTWAGKENPNIRSYPRLAAGNEVDVCDTLRAADGKKWYYIRIKGKYYGFVKASYIKKN